MLGCVLNCCGDASATRALTCGRIRGAGIRNASILNRACLGIGGRMRFWKSIIDGVIGYRAAAMRPTKLTYTKLDSANNLVLREMLRLERNPWEAVPAFKKRMAAQMRQIRDEHCVCASTCYLEALVRWVAHCQRHPSLSASKLLTEQDDAWLATQRASGSGDRPGTRAEAGCVSRWAEGWFLQGQVEVGWRVLRRDRPAITERGNWLRRWLFGDGPPLLSLVDDVQLSIE